MNKRFKTLRHWAFISLGVFALAACEKETPVVDPDKPKDEKVVSDEKKTETPIPSSDNIVKISSDAPQPGTEVEIPVVSTEQVVDKFPGINKTNISKVVLRMYEGHLHGADLHYVAGPKGFNSKNLSYEQEMTLEYRNNEWVVTSGEKFFLFIRGNAYATVDNGRYVEPVVPQKGKLPDSSKKEEVLPAPVYGLWAEYYDAEDNLLNSGIAAEGAFQTFFRTRDLKHLSNGNSFTPLSGEFMGYIYRDTTPFDQTKHSGLAKYSDQTNPVGLKGFFFFNDRDARFALNLELWQTPRGKLTDGERAPFSEPSEHIKKTGRPVLSISIPSYVFLTNDEFLNYEADTTFEGHTAEDQALFRNLMNILNLNWEQTLADIIRRIEGEREGEEGGQWF